MKENKQDIAALLAEIESLKEELYESNSIVNAIKQGDVDALVVSSNGVPEIYSLETADYTYRLLIEKFGQEKIIGNYLSEYFVGPAQFVSIIEALRYGITTHEILFKSENEKKIFPAYIALTDLEPAVEAIGIVITDLTEKKKHEEALIRHQAELEEKIDELNKTNRNLEEFIHVISHDLKEPLRKIVMNTSRIDESYFKEAEVKAVNVMKLSALRLNSLVDDLVQ